MKKILKWMLINILAMFLIGCGGTTDTNTTGVTNNSTPTEKEVSITTTKSYKNGYFTNFTSQNGNNLFEEADGTLHLAFIDNYELFYATSKDKGLTWSKEQIITNHEGAIRRASLTVDGNGKVFIAFTTQDKFNYANPTQVVYGQEFEYNLYCATNMGGTTWSIETLYTYQSRNNSQEIASINVDKDNNIYVFANYYGWWSYGGTAYEYIRSASTNAWSSAKEIVKYSDTVVDKGIYGYFSSHIATNGDITLTMMRYRTDGGLDDKLFYVKKQNGQWQSPVEVDTPNRTNARTYHFDTAIDKSNHIYLAYVKDNTSGVPQVLFSKDFLGTSTIYSGNVGDIIHGIKLHSDADGNLLLLIDNDTKKSILLTKTKDVNTWSSAQLATETTQGIISSVSAVQTNTAQGSFSTFKMSYFGKFKTVTGDGPFDSGKLYFYNHGIQTSTTTTGTTIATSNNKTIRIGHSGGIDFSKDNNLSNGEEQDGYAVVWSPSKYVTGEEYGKGIWYNTNVSDPSNTYRYIQALGEVDLDSVTSIDTTAWYPYNDALKSLQKNEVYVVKTRDGYAKFKVLSVDFISSDWNFEAEYVFSPTNTF